MRRWLSREIPATGDSGRIVLGSRLALLVLCIVLSAFGTRPMHLVPAIAILVAVAILASLPIYPPQVATWVPVAEALAAGLAIGLTDPIAQTLLPYLMVPALAAGLRAGLGRVAMTTGASLVGIVIPRIVAGRHGASSSELSALSEWLLLSFAIGILASWFRRIQEQRDGDAASYAEANRLLTALRDVSRQLSGGLDAFELGNRLMDDLIRDLGADYGGVFVADQADVMSPLTVSGPIGENWFPEVNDDSIWARAWRTGQPQQLAGGLSQSPLRTTTGAVLPLRAGDGNFGLVGLERVGAPFDPKDLRVAMSWVDQNALRLQTALLFSEVRTIATAEERRRLAREIHDGIAQELASLGYVVDDLGARVDKDPDLKADLKALRNEMTRVVTELRLSIFDLRSDVHAGASLGTALSDYVRSSAHGRDVTTHLVIEESSQRLRLEAESELLRIAQEAVTNARKHSRAHNVWVTCRVNPPRALLRVEDDGRGLGMRRRDSYGMEVMRERAARLGATLDVVPRPGGGTRVEVVMGGPMSDTDARNGGHDGYQRVAR